MSDEIVTPDCPQCGKADAIDLDSGDRLCLNCRNEWDPKRKHAMPTTAFEPEATRLQDKYDIAQILNAPTVADVLGTPPRDIVDMAVINKQLPEGAPPIEEWPEQFVRTSGGDVLLVTEVMPNGLIRGRDRWGTEYEVGWWTVTYLGDDPAEALDMSGVVGEVSAEPVIPAVLAVAGLALTVGLQAISEDEEVGLTHAPIGWLPPPANECPEAEQGVAYAIALLIRIFGIDKEQVAKLASNLLVGSEAGIVPEGEGQTE